MQHDRHVVKEQIRCREYRTKPHLFSALRDVCGDSVYVFASFALQRAKTDNAKGCWICTLVLNGIGAVCYI